MLQTTSIFGAFTSPQRLAVAKAIVHQPCHVTGIIEQTNLEQALVSQTLMKFRALDLVGWITLGSRRYYHFKQPRRVNQLLTIAESLAP